MVTQEQLNGWYDHKSNKEKETEKYDCETCQDTGEVSCMERVYPGEPHMANIGTEPCPDCRGADNEIDMSGASDGDR